MSLCDALNTIQPFDKEKWKSQLFRQNNQNELREEFKKIFITQTAEFLEILLNEYNVPAGKVRTIPEVVSEEQFLQRKLWNKIKIKSINKDFMVPSIGFKVNENVVKPENPPPILGGDTISILSSLGIQNHTIDKLKKENIIK
jgi:crotonobetainyl-CoA:carnitine CoA-transferase CaiB-like acyl-CoA transferase